MKDHSSHIMTNTISAASIEELAARSGIEAEHVLLEGGQVFDANARSQTIAQRFQFRNRLRDTATEFVLFDDDFVSVRHTRKGGQRQAERTLDLRYLDARPIVSRDFAKTPLRAAAATLLVALVAGLFAYAGIVPRESLLVCGAFGFAALAASFIYIKRREERTAFRTRHGRAVVLGIVASFGCMRSARRCARELVHAIVAAQRRSTLDKDSALRAEIQEHYRLASAGQLTEQARTAAIRKILARFD